MNKRQFNTRLIVSGAVLEKFEYERPILKGMMKKRRTGRANALHTSKEVKELNRMKTAQRAKRYVQRKINANPQLKKFLTLTYAENETDLDIARKDFDKFVKRMKTWHKEFQYIDVLEFQKRGAVHFHLLCNLPYVDVNKVADIWGHGFVKLNRIDNVDNVGAYVTKYMTKDNMDERLIGRKCYSMSKGLNEPETITDDDTIDDVMFGLENVKRVYTAEYETEYYGVVKYTQVICSEPIYTPPRRRFNRFYLRDILIPMPDDTPTPFDPSPTT